MPDITMCMGTGCPKKGNCYRALATPTPKWQSWFAEVPYDQEKQSCDAFVEFAEKVSPLKKFIRSTHDQDGNYKFEEKQHLPWFEVRQKETGIVVHMLDSRKPMTFQALLNKHHKYDESERQGPINAHLLAYQLTVALELGLASVSQD